MKKALLLAVMALSLASCNATTLKGTEAEWRDDALSIEVTYGYEYGGDTYRKEESEGLKRDLLYKINGESSLTIKTILTYKAVSTRDKPFQETHIYDFLNCSYKITLVSPNEE